MPPNDTSTDLASSRESGDPAALVQRHSIPSPLSRGLKAAGMTMLWQWQSCALRG